MKPDYKNSDVYKRLHFITENPNLSGDEEVVARAGQNIEDPWAKENQNTGLFGAHPLDKNGQVTPQYKKLLNELHMVDLKPPGKVQPSKKIEELNLKWRKIQSIKKKLKENARKSIQDQWIKADNKKLEYLNSKRVLK